MAHSPFSLTPAHAGKSFTPGTSVEFMFDRSELAGQAVEVEVLVDGKRSEVSRVQLDRAGRGTGRFTWPRHAPRDARVELHHPSAPSFDLRGKEHGRLQGDPNWRPQGAPSGQGNADEEQRRSEAQARGNENEQRAAASGRPPNPREGQRWVNTSTGETLEWDGKNWRPMQQQGAGPGTPGTGQNPGPGTRVNPSSGEVEPMEQQPGSSPAGTGGSASQPSSTPTGHGTAAGERGGSSQRPTGHTDTGGSPRPPSGDGGRR